jgi:hypothetical protein
MAAATAAEAPATSFNPKENALLRVLASRRWRFRDPIDEAVQALLYSSPSPSPEALESELVDMDLRVFGDKSLPDRATTALCTSMVLSSYKYRYLYQICEGKMPYLPVFQFAVDLARKIGWYGSG